MSVITPERAAEAVQRLINSHFHNDNRARCSIPADEENDDDLVATRFVKQQKQLLAAADKMREALDATRLQLAQSDLLNYPETQLAWDEGVAALEAYKLAKGE